MNKTLIIALGAVALVAGCKCAHAGTGYTGNDLLNDLGSPQATREAFGMGVVYGVWQGFETGELFGSASLDSALYCTPENATLGQVVEATKRHLRENYATRHQDASAFVVMALAKMWPCKKPAAQRRKGSGGQL